MTASQLLLFKSAAPYSGGGVITVNPVPETGKNNIFSDTLWQGLRDGQIVYRKIFLKNTDDSATLDAVTLWVLQPTDREHVGVGVGTADDSDGTTITYSTPTRDNPLALPDLAPGVAVALWIRKITDANTPDFVDNNFFQIIVNGNPI